VLLPAILVLFVVVIVYALRPRVQPHREVDEAMPVGPAAEGVKITRLIGGQPDLEASAGKVTRSRTATTWKTSTVSRSIARASRR
jgi:hypothetical protein